MSKLDELLNEQLGLVTAIKELLAEEFVVLKERRAFSLPEIEKRKQSLLETITANDKTISEQPDRDRLKNDLKQAKEHIVDILKECHRQNAVNGKLIQMSMVANRRLGQVLSQIKDRNSMTYTSEGSTTTSSSSGLNIEC